MLQPLKKSVTHPVLSPVSNKTYVDNLLKFLNHQMELTEAEILSEEDLIEVLRLLPYPYWTPYLNLPCIQQLWKKIKKDDDFILNSLEKFTHSQRVAFLMLPDIQEQMGELFKGRPEIIYELLNVLNPNHWDYFLTSPAYIERLNRDICKSLSSGENVFTQIRSSFDTSEKFMLFLSKKVMNKVLVDVINNAFCFSVILLDYEMAERWTLIAKRGAMQGLYIHFIIHDNPAPLFDRLVISEGTEEERRVVAEVTQKALEFREALPTFSSVQHQSTTLFKRMPEGDHRRFLRELEASLQSTKVSPVI
jgi:hypothetical protein